MTARAFLIPLLCLCSLSARAQSVDSLWILKDVRGFTDRHRTVLLVPLVAGTVAAQGYLHGSFYSRGAYGDIHGAAEILGALHYTTAVVSGLDFVQAYGATLAGNFFFQGFVNLGAGLPFVNPREARAYEAFGHDISWKRWHIGYMRWAGLVVGVVLILYKPIWRAIR